MEKLEESIIEMVLVTQEKKHWVGEWEQKA